MKKKRHSHWQPQAGVQHFVKLGLADGSRVGICGWSYGGYMSVSVEE